VPFARSDIRREVPHTEAPNVAADFLSVYHGAVPRPIVGHWTFHGELVRVAVYHDKNKLALRHRKWSSVGISIGTGSDARQMLVSL
jgi:hypothetical protein